MAKYQHPGSEFTQGYRWRGWRPQHILTSGLDDYPRAQPPNPEGLHVDALSWVGAMAMALDEISAFLGDDETQKIYVKHTTEVVRSIDGIHWSEPDQAYCDTTLADGNRVDMVCHKGYISLFPFLVGLIGPDHPRLNAVLDLILDTKELWSPHGLRSLSATDKYYGSGEDYWRGPVWINVNYMVVQKLLVSMLIYALSLDWPSAVCHDLLKSPGTCSTTRPMSTKSAQGIYDASVEPLQHCVRVVEGDWVCLGAV